MLSETVLSANLECFAVEFPVFIKIIAGLFEESPALLRRRNNILMLYDSCNFCIKNPVYQIVFILEMVVEAFTVHFALGANIRNRDLLKGHLCHQLFHGICQCFLCDIGIRHFTSPLNSKRRASPAKSQISLVISGNTRIESRMLALPHGSADYSLISNYFIKEAQKWQ